MNDLSNGAMRERNRKSCQPIPTIAICILVPVFLIGLSISLLVLIVVRNAAFLIAFVFLSALVVSFTAWNRHNWRHKAAVFSFLHSFPDSDLTSAREGQLVKITGVVSCGSVSLESSYERVTQCIYASTSLYEYGGFGEKLTTSCLHWSSTYCERLCTDFYITDGKSGIRAMVKAGPSCKVVPLIVESELVTTTRQRRILSPHLRRWLQERNLSTEARLLRLEEGYIQEGSIVTVIGLLHRSNGALMIVQPQELLSTGCLWQKLLLPVDVDGLVLTVVAGPVLNQDCRQHLEQ